MASNTLADNSSEWPQRLLRVDCDTLISYERTPGNVYGGVTEPQYNIITYTWGRFQVPDGPSIPVQGIDWRIPPIDERRFTVDDFTKLIRKVGSEFGWVWLDVACIDQRNDSPMKKIEIGRQASIFNRAEKVYIWFHSLSTQRLQEYVTQIDYSGGSLAFTAFLAVELYRMDGRKAFVHSTLQSLEGWFDDPWWSSLWTLQEAYFRTDAYLLSKSAEEATLSGDSAWLVQLISSCSSIFRKTVGLIEDDHNTAYTYGLANLEKIRAMVKRSGCYALNALCPTALYGAVQARRQTYTVDRIYGIMQVYGLKLGESADPERTFTLSELELQLAQALNHKSPVLAQLFVHVQPPAGPSWAISEACETPERGRMCVKPELFSEMTFSSIDEPSVAAYQGRSCPLSALAKDWIAASSTSERPGDCPVHSVHLDASVKNSTNIPRELLTLNLSIDQRQHQLVRLLVENYADKPLQVLLLGRFVGGARGNIIKYWHGLIVHPQGGPENTIQWSRIGFCVWECTQDHDPTSEDAGAWTQFSGLLV